MLAFRTEIHLDIWMLVILEVSGMIWPAWISWHQFWHIVSHRSEGQNSSPSTASQPSSHLDQGTKKQYAACDTRSGAWVYSMVYLSTTQGELSARAHSQRSFKTRGGISDDRDQYCNQRKIQCDISMKTMQRSNCWSNKFFNSMTNSLGVESISQWGVFHLKHSDGSD